MPDATDYSDDKVGDPFDLDSDTWDELFYELPEAWGELLSEDQNEPEIDFATNDHGLDLNCDEYFVYLCMHPTLVRDSSTHREKMRTFLENKLLEQELLPLGAWGENKCTSKQSIPINDSLRSKITSFGLKLRVKRLIEITLNISEYLKNTDKRQAIKDILSTRCSQAIKSIYQELHILLPKNGEHLSGKNLKILLSVFTSELPSQFKALFLDELRCDSPSILSNIKDAVKKMQRWPKRHIKIKNQIESLLIDNHSSLIKTTQSDSVLTNPPKVIHHSTNQHCTQNSRKRYHQNSAQQGSSETKTQRLHFTGNPIRSIPTSTTGLCSTVVALNQSNNMHNESPRFFNTNQNLQGVDGHHTMEPNHFANIGGFNNNDDRMNPLHSNIIPNDRSTEIINEENSPTNVIKEDSGLNTPTIEVPVSCFSFFNRNSNTHNLETSDLLPTPILDKR